MKALRINDYVPEISKPFTITEENLPLYIFIKLVEPELTGWKFIYKIEALDDDTIDYLGNRLMSDVKAAVEFSDEIAIRYKMPTTWKVEISFWSDITKKGLPTGNKIFQDKIILYTPERAGVIPKRMAKYIQIEEEKKENKPTDVLSSLQNLSIDQLVVLATIGGLDINKLIENLAKLKLGEIPEIPKEKEAKKETKTEIKDDIDNIIDDIVAKQKVIEDVSAPTDVISGLMKMIQQGREILPIVRDILAELKVVFGTDNRKVEELSTIVKKQNKVLNSIIDRLERLEKGNEIEISIDKEVGK